MRTKLIFSLVIFLFFSIALVFSQINFFSKIKKEMEKLEALVKSEFENKSRNSEFFVLNPNGIAGARGKIVSFNEPNLKISVQEYQISWVLTTSTQILSKKNKKLDFTELKPGRNLRIFGRWDREKFLATKIIIEIEEKSNFLKKYQDLLKGRFKGLIPSK